MPRSGNPHPIANQGSHEYLSAKAWMRSQIRRLRKPMYDAAYNKRKRFLANPDHEEETIGQIQREIEDGALFVTIRR